MKDIRRQVDRNTAPAPSSADQPVEESAGPHLMPCPRVAATAATTAARPAWLVTLADYVDADQAEGPVAAAVDDGDDDARRRHPSIGLILATCLGGYLSAGGAGAVNHWFDRDIDAQMARTADRPVPSGRISPPRRAGVRLRAGGALAGRAVAAGQPAGGRAVVLRVPRLRLRLHRLAQAHDAAEHRHRRRGGRGAAAGRLGRRPRLGGRHGADPVLHRLLLDAAALLGAVAADEGASTRRSASRCCPVVRGEAETRRQILLYSVLLYAVTQLPFCAGGFGAVYLAGSLALGLAFIGGAVRLYRRADRRSPCSSTSSRCLPRAAVRRDGRRRQAL